jgi:hypothetical protein
MITKNVFEAGVIFTDGAKRVQRGRRRVWSTEGVLDFFTLYEKTFFFGRRK